MSYKKNNYWQISILVLLCFGFSCKNESNTISQDKQSRVDVLPYYNEASYTPHWFAKNSDSLKTFHKIPGFNLINQDSIVVTQKTFADKIYIADFFFTSCPGICPKMTKNMGELQSAFLKNEDILLLSHSVTPDKDSVDVLKRYAEKNDVISKKWHLVTGKRSEIYNLGRNFYYAEEDLGEVKTEDDFLHTENFVLVDKNKYIRGIYNGLNKTDIKQLIADVKTLQME